jgi:hypothetical protein
MRGQPVGDRRELGIVDALPDEAHAAACSALILSPSSEPSRAEPASRGRK